MKDVAIFRRRKRDHRFNAPLQYLDLNNKIRITEREYPLPTKNQIVDLPQNIDFIRPSTLQSFDSIIIGVEPFDWTVPLLRYISRFNDVVLQCSWPSWTADFVPYTPHFPEQIEQWEKLTNGLPAVGVTNAVTEAMSLFGANSHKIPHCVDTSVYRPREEIERASEQNVLFVGRLVEEKGVKQILSIAQSWTGSKVEFLFVGDGPLATEVKKAAKSDNVSYYGYVSDEGRLAKLYRGSDVFVLPSYRSKKWEELFGIVLIEAFASGTPVVATDCVGPREIVDDGETGYLVEPKNEDAFADALHSLLEDDERREAFGKRARTVAETTYDIELVADQWLEVLQDVSPGLNVQN